VARITWDEIGFEVVESLYEHGGRFAVLGCDCGEPGCWPPACRIEVDERSVVWRDFVQPHRSDSGLGPVWLPEGLGPFRFSRPPYPSARIASTGSRRAALRAASQAAPSPTPPSSPAPAA